MAGRCRDTWAAPLPLLLLAPTLLLSVQLPPSVLRVLLGGNLSIPFSYPPTQPPPSIVWRRNLTTLAFGYLDSNGTMAVAQAYQARLSVDPHGGMLNITRVTFQDAGTYTVEVFPLGGQLWMGEVQVEVYELVGDVLVTPPSLEVMEGDESVVLTCAPIRGTVTWTKDGQSLAQNPRYRVSPGILQINQPVRSDTGTYSCTVSNPFSSGTSTTRIRVYYGPETPTISISSDGNPEPRRYVRVNSTVVLSCQALSDPPVQIYWNLADASDPLVPALPNLTLPQVQLSQAGSYSCVASNLKTQQHRRATLTLTVTQIPPGSPICSLDAVSNGTALRFRCFWQGGSPAPTLSLQGLPGGEEQGVGSALERTLSPPLPNLNGTRVTCVGRHLAAEGSCSMTPEAPSGVSLSFQASLNPGGQVLVKLRCQGSYRPVEISWAGAALGTGTRYQVSADGAQLTITNFTVPQDLGGYSVWCQNPLGSQDSNLTLTGPAISSWSLRRELEPSSAWLSWVVPEGSVVTEFWIQVQGSFGNRAAGQWQTLQALGGSNRSSIVEGLQPHSTYSFRLLPLLGTQPGEPSHTQTLPPASTLTSGAIAGIVLGSILGMILIIALLVLLICFLRARRGKKEKRPLTPPGTRQHYLPRQFPNGGELDPIEPPASPSWGSPRCSWGDSSLFFISYEKHLRIHGPPASWPWCPGEGQDSSCCGLPAGSSQHNPRTTRSATRV